MIERYTNPAMGRVWSEQTKHEKWLAVEIAVCEAWAEVGRIPQEALPAIRRATFELDRVQEHFRRTRHDVTAFLKAVQETIGPEEARYIHFGLTSSDVIDTALSLQVIEAIDLIHRGLDGLESVLIDQARRHRRTVMIGRTHGVHAEPTTFGLKMALWIDEVRRHRQRLDQARETMAVGKLSGAVGTHANVPPVVEEIACRRLGLAVAPVSTQIIQRDRHAQFITTLAGLAASLEKFATEVRHLQRTEVLEAEEPFGEGQTGSSAMPHKRNPELTERVCGLARVVRGHAVTALENVALWHERDISHSSAERIVFPDSCILIDYLLGIFTQVMAGLRVDPDRMKRNLELTGGLINSQRVLLALIDKGLDRQEAYHIVQRHALAGWQGQQSFRALLEADPEVSGRLTPAELDDLFGLDYHLQYVDDIFARIGL
ncbi:MAG TPA: adenylosuccinate lyase [Dehalococcoidia bacterium]|nr:adenylosuccinate lyase [Dehalococcoidia bacterium]